MTSEIHPSVGGTLEDFLEELGEREEVYGAAIKRGACVGNRECLQATCREQK